MKCIYCDTDMEKVEIRGLWNTSMSIDHHANTMMIHGMEMSDGLFGKKSGFLGPSMIETKMPVNPEHYVCPECGMIIQKIPQDKLGKVIEISRDRTNELNKRGEPDT